MVIAKEISDRFIAGIHFQLTIFSLPSEPLLLAFGLCLIPLPAEMYLNSEWKCPIICTGIRTRLEAGNRWV